MSRKTKEPEIVESVLPPAHLLDKTKPLTDEQYGLIANMPSNMKKSYMNGWKTSDWSDAERNKHYQAAHFPELRYHSSGGGGKGSASPSGKSLI